MALDISQFFKPVARLELSSGSLFLYALRTQDIETLSTLPKEATPKIKLKALIEASTSREEYRREVCDKPVRLRSEDVELLQEAEMSMLCDAMLEPKNFNRFWSVTKESESHLPRLAEGDAATNRIASLVDWRVAEEARRRSELHEAIQGSPYGPVQQWIDDARKKQSAFGHSIDSMQKAFGNVDTGALSQIKRFLNEDDARRRMLDANIWALERQQAEMVEWAKKSVRDDFSAQSPRTAHQMDMVFNDVVSEQHRINRGERAQELHDMRSMTDASITTARVMNKLSNDVLDILSAFNSVANENRKAQADSVRTALRTFIGGAILALGAVVFAVLSYFQDRANNENNDKWQERVEKLLVQREDSARELESVKQDNKQIRAKLADLEVSARRLSIDRVKPSLP